MTVIKSESDYPKCAASYYGENMSNHKRFRARVDRSLCEHCKALPRPEETTSPSIHVSFVIQLELNNALRLLRPATALLLKPFHHAFKSRPDPECLRILHLRRLCCCGCNRSECCLESANAFSQSGVEKRPSVSQWRLHALSGLY